MSLYSKEIIKCVSGTGRTSPTLPCVNSASCVGMAIVRTEKDRKEYR